MFDEGYLRIATWRGAPVRVHWSTVLGAWVFGGFHFDAVLIAAYFALVLLHELGHATVVRATGQEVVSVDVHALGGACRWRGVPSAGQRAAIAWGGVLAQALLYAGTRGWLWWHGAPTSPEALSIIPVFTRINLTLIAINLLPVSPLDGAEAWKPLGNLGRLFRASRSSRLGRFFRWSRASRVGRARRRGVLLTPPLVTPPPAPRHALPSDGEAPDPPMPEELRRSVERIFEASRPRRG